MYQRISISPSLLPYCGEQRLGETITQYYYLRLVEIECGPRFPQRSCGFHPPARWPFPACSDAAFGRRGIVPVAHEPLHLVLLRSVATVRPLLWIFKYPRVPHPFLTRVTHWVAIWIPTLNPINTKWCPPACGHSLNVLLCCSFLVSIQHACLQCTEYINILRS